MVFDVFDFSLRNHIFIELLPPSFCRHSNGSNEDGDDQVDDTRSLSRSASENNIETEQSIGAHNGNGGLPNINNNISSKSDSNDNNGYTKHNFLQYNQHIF